MLGARIGPLGCPAERLLDRIEAGDFTPVVIDRAMSAVRAGDTIDHARFARLLHHA